ncbi:MAG: alpha/beta hydrolase [Firmicutes bacterium]|nr:alpha/beta hydrolase [[Eubacterium] siraeum]MCM1487466.1 alpha/beta hydrolase [Bacillota bacterium]
MKKRKVCKIIIRALITMLAAVVLFVSGTFIFHRVKTGRETELLKEKGYYNPVSVDDCRLNVAGFGNKNGEHTIIAIAGLGSGDFPVAVRQMTAPLEKDNLIVFVDRAGYGFSDDTDCEMTLEYIVEDYRKALKNAGIEAPYILMPHSIGGAYATYWVSRYPEEIEAVIFVDGSQLSSTAFDDSPSHNVGIKDKALAFLAKAGLSRYVLRDYFYRYSDNFTEEEQELADALMYMTLDSVAPVSEEGLLAENARNAFNGIVTNDVPKLYICASWGFETKEDIIEYHMWINRQIEINDMDIQPQPTQYSDEMIKEILDSYEQVRQEIIFPYTEKLGNCKVVCVGGDHMIYEQKPKECAEIIIEFLKSLNQ